MQQNDFVISAYGVRMPRIIYGTAWKKERTAALVEKAVTLGFRGIDTACQPKHYHELGVGEGLAACLTAGLVTRADIYLQSKFTPLSGQDPERIPYDSKSALSEQVAQSFQTSLSNLKTTYLDALVLHSPLTNEAQLIAVWRSMEDIFAAGGVLQLGISNCYSLAQLESLYEKAKIKPAVLQNRFHGQTGYDSEIREFCRQRQIFYQSFWTLTANPDILQHAVIQTLAEKYQRSPAQIFFRYLSQIDIIPLTGTTAENHMREDLAIFEFELTPIECDAISRLL
ncbi:MAG: aldo/keto reductase family protein [Methylococcaceae bacterium]